MIRNDQVKSVRHVHPEFDIVVVGAGHAGCEAALAASRAGCRTLVVTPNLDRVGYMPCNPSIGGPGKSHIVSEIDALGGEMARAADRAALQVRMLNTSKGPAVQALRIQADKSLYAMAMKEALESQPNITLVQDAATGVVTANESRRPEIRGVTLRAMGHVAARRCSHRQLRSPRTSGRRRFARLVLPGRSRRTNRPARIASTSNPSFGDRRSRLASPARLLATRDQRSGPRLDSRQRPPGADVQRQYRRHWTALLPFY